MADVITPDTFSGAFEMPATMGGRRTSQFTKEDLVRALLQAQAQPKSPYSLQFEAPVITGAAPSGEEQFQRDWDTAMAQYQARIAQPRVLPQGITYGGQTNLDTPQAAFQETLAPLRFQAAEFAPDISREFAQQELDRYRQSEAAHRLALEKQAQDRVERENIRFQRESMDEMFKRAQAKAKAAQDQANKEAELGLRERALRLRERQINQSLGLAEPDVTQAEPEPTGPESRYPLTFNIPAAQIQAENQMRMPQGRTGLAGPPRPNEANMVLMVDAEGKQWQIPADQVSKAESKYKLRRMQ